MENYAVIYVQCFDAEKLKRIEFYLNGETRPDFPEDVPGSEAQLVEVFEFLPTPESLQCLDLNGLTAHFAPDSLEEMKDLVKGAALFRPDKLLMFFADDEETRHYYCHQDSKLNFMMSEIPFDDPADERKYNRKLPPKLANSIKDMDDKSKALELLAHNI